MRLLLIRHGETPSNLYAALDTTVPGPALTELGVQQAEAIPDALASEDIGAMFASTQTRARLTAVPLATRLGLPVTIRDGLREISAGDLEMNHDRESLRTYYTTGFAWSSGRLEKQIPGGESGVAFYERFDRVIDEAVSLGHGTVACVSHGMAIRSWTAARSSNVNTEFARRNVLPNTGVITLEGSQEEGWTTLSWAGLTVGGQGLTMGGHPSRGSIGDRTRGITIEQ